MGKIKCHSCEASLTKTELKIIPEVEADESGVYVIYEYICPHCYEPIHDRRLRNLKGYPAPSYDEPLRWED